MWGVPLLPVADLFSTGEMVSDNPQWEYGPAGRLQSQVPVLQQEMMQLLLVPQWERHWEKGDSLTLQTSLPQTGNSKGQLD